MKLESLRKLIREEVEQAFEEADKVDSHPKFRKLVGRALGRSLAEGERHDETWHAWNELQVETAGAVDRRLLSYYVNQAARAILQS